MRGRARRGRRSRRNPGTRLASNRTCSRWACAVRELWSSCGLRDHLVDILGGERQTVALRAAVDGDPDLTAQQAGQLAGEVDFGHDHARRLGRELTDRVDREWTEY